MTYPTNDWHNSGLPISEFELREAMQRMDDVMRQPRGQRYRQVLAIASDYGVSDRTLYRWRRATFHDVRIAGFRALYMVASGHPVRVTSWERAA